MKAALMKVLNRRNWTYNTTTSRGRGRSGQADYTVNVAGKYVPIETKVDNPEPTALQHNELVRHAQAGALGVVLARTGLRIYPPYMEGRDLYLSVDTEDLETALRRLEHILDHHAEQ